MRWRWSLGREEGVVVDVDVEYVEATIFLIWEGERTVRMLELEGVERVDSRRERRRAVHTCGTEFGDEECRDHSAMQTLVPSLFPPPSSFPPPAPFTIA